MTSRSTPSWRALRPRRFLSGRTAANRPSSRRKRTFRLPSGGPGGDSSLVLSANPLVRTARSIASGRAGPPRSSDAWPARCSSQSMATPAASRPPWTAGTRSTPMPPPWISVTRRDMPTPSAAQVRDQLLGDRRRVAVAAQVARQPPAVLQRPPNRLLDPAGRAALADVFEEQRRRARDRDRVGHALARDVRGAAVDRLEHGV